MTKAKVDPVKLRSTLAAREIKPYQFADACGISRSSASAVLRGRHRPGKYVGRGIAEGLKALGIPPEEVGSDE